jgi:hypothetical protein
MGLNSSHARWPRRVARRPNFGHDVDPILVNARDDVFAILDTTAFGASGPVRDRDVAQAPPLSMNTACQRPRAGPYAAFCRETVGHHVHGAQRLRLKGSGSLR